MHQHDVREIPPLALLSTDLEVEARRMVEQDRVIREADTLGVTLAEYRLRKIQDLLGTLSDMRTRLTVELFHTDPAQFETLAGQAQKVIRDLRVTAVAFQAQVQAEYPQSSWIRRFWSGVMGLIFVPWQRYADAQRRRDAHRVALMDAQVSYEQIVQEYERYIKDVRDSRFRHRQHELLAADKRYQQVVHEEHEAQADLSWLENVNRSQAKAVQNMLVKLCDRWNEGQYWYYDGSYEYTSKKYIDSGLTLSRLRQLMPVQVVAYSKEREFLEQHALLTAREEAESSATS